METINKEKIITALFVLLFVVILIFAGNIIVIGNQIKMATNDYCAYAFYIVIIGLLTYFIVRPTIKMMKTPKVTEFKQITDDISDEDLQKIGERLKEADFNDDSFGRKFDYYNSSSSYKAKQIDNIKSEITRRQNLIDNEVSNSAIKAGVLTAISQNSKIDTISVLIVNFKMISKLIRIAGFSPSNSQWLKIYWRILSSGVFAYALSETFDALTDNLGTDISEKLLGLFGKVAKPISDGIINGLLTLRLGYVTKKYLELGEEDFAKTDYKKIYQEAKEKMYEVDNLTNLKDEIKKRIKAA